MYIVNEFNNKKRTKENCEHPLSPKEELIKRRKEHLFYVKCNNNNCLYCLILSSYTYTRKIWLTTPTTRNASAKESSRDHDDAIAVTIVGGACRDHRWYSAAAGRASGWDAV